jgi:uncharacterized protein YjbJ (UPF0337 family)
MLRNTKPAGGISGGESAAWDSDIEWRRATRLQRGGSHPVNDDMDRDYNTDQDNPDLDTRGAKNEGKGAMDKVSGKVQEGWGKLTNDQSDVIEGKVKQGKGSMEQGLGNAERDLDDTLDQ